MAEVAVFGASSEVGTAGRLKLLHKDDDREDVGGGEVGIFAVSRLPRPVAQASLFQFADSSCLAFIGLSRDAAERHRPGDRLERLSRDLDPDHACSQLPPVSAISRKMTSL